MKKYAILLALPFMLAVSGCTSRIGANDYATATTGQVNRAVEGVVVNVRRVQVQSDNGAGALVGGAAGAVGGYAIGGDKTAHILGAIGGAVLGSMAGDAAQSALSSQAAYEYVIRLNTGSMVTITQGDDVLLTPGQKCLVLYGAQSRVVPANY